MVSDYIYIYIYIYIFFSPACLQYNDRDMLLLELSTPCSGNSSVFKSLNTKVTIEKLELAICANCLSVAPFRETVGLRLCVG